MRFGGGRERMEAAPSDMSRRLARGYRYRLHDRKLPGRPDIVFRGRRALIMIHGCFWHAHGCHLSATPATRREFWENKLRENRARDDRNLSALSQSGWRTLIIWECALRGKNRQDLNVVIDACEQFLNDPEMSAAIIQGYAQLGGAGEVGLDHQRFGRGCTGFKIGYTGHSG